MNDLPQKDWLIRFFGILLIVGIVLIVASVCNPSSRISENGGSPELKIPAPLRIGPHTNIIPMSEYENWHRISIDCTNDFDGTRMGHNTERILKPGESIEIRYAEGWCSYKKNLKPDKIELGKAGPSGGFDLSESDIKQGKRIRYPNIRDGYLAVLVILRTDSGKEEIKKFPNGRILQITNLFDEPAKLFFFFNGLESFYNTQGEREDGFKYNGWDGSRVVFDIYS